MKKKLHLGCFLVLAIEYRYITYILIFFIFLEYLAN